MFVVSWNPPLRCKFDLEKWESSLRITLEILRHVGALYTILLRESIKTKNDKILICFILGILLINLDISSKEYNNPSLFTIILLNVHKSNDIVCRLSKVGAVCRPFKLGAVSLDKQS